MLEILKFQCYHTILSCFFFLFFVMLNNFLIIPVVREKIKVRLALAIPAGTPTTLVNEMIQTPLLVTIKTTQILLNFYLIFN